MNHDGDLLKDHPLVDQLWHVPILRLYPRIRDGFDLDKMVTRHLKKNGAVTKHTFSRKLALDSTALAIPDEAQVNVVLPLWKEAIYNDYSLFATFSHPDKDVLPGCSVDVDGEKSFGKNIRDERCVLFLRLLMFASAVIFRFLDKRRDIEAFVRY